MIRKNRWPSHHARERIPRRSGAGAVPYGDLIKLGQPTINVKALDVSKSQNDAKVKPIPPPSNTKKANPPPSTSSSSSSSEEVTITKDHSPFSDAVRKKKVTPKRGRQKDPIIYNKSPSSSSSSSEVIAKPVQRKQPVRGASSKSKDTNTLTELKMSDLDAWYNELNELRSIMKQRFDAAVHINMLNEKIIKLEETNSKLVDENLNLTATVRHLISTQKDTGVKEEDCIVID